MGFFRQFWAGRKLANALLSGQFDDSPVAQQFALWFGERPAREEQRQTFVQLATALRCPSGIVAERLMHCITEVWRGQGAEFGDRLAQEIDRMFTFDPPKSAEQGEQQRVAKEGFADLQARLRALDTDIA